MDGSVNDPSIFDVRIVQEKASDLNIRDVDSDVLFDSEQAATSEGVYLKLKALALKSADSFQRLYDAFPNKNLFRTSCEKNILWKRSTHCQGNGSAYEKCQRLLLWRDRG